MTTTVPRWARALLGLSIGALTLSMGVSTGAGLTQGWPEWALILWIGMVVVGTFATVVLLGNAAGLLNNRSLAELGSPRGRVPPLGAFIAVYAGSVLRAVASGIYLQYGFGVPAQAGVLVSSGSILVAASSGRPWWLFETMRRVRWLGSIRSDATARSLLLLLGAGAVLAGLLMAAGGTASA